MTFSIKLIAALLFGLMSFIAYAPITGVILSVMDMNPAQGLILGVILAATTGLICLIAPSRRKAWARGSLITGALLVISPFAAKYLHKSIPAEVQNSADEMLAQAPPADPNAEFVIQSVEVVATTSTLGTAFLILGVFLIILGLFMEFGKRSDV